MSIIRQSNAGKNRVTGSGPPNETGSNATITNIVSWVNGIVHGVSHFLQTPLGKFIEGVAIFVSPLLRVIAAATFAFDRIVAWIETTVEKRIMTILVKWYKQLHGLILFYWQQAVKEDLFLFYITKLNMLAEIRAERKARNQAIARAKHELTLRIKHLHQTIEREAASGYRLGRSAHTDLITRLAEYIGVHNPIVRGLVTDLVAGVIDLFGVESAPARLLLGFLLKRIIAKLGVDQIVGRYLDDLLAPLLGQPEPRDLHGVIAAIVGRLNAGEQRWAQFFEDGGSDVEQAGEQWQAITSPIGDALVLAFLGQAVLAPATWATEIQDTIGTVAEDIAATAVNLIRGA